MNDRDDALERAYAVQIQAELIDRGSNVKALAAELGIAYSALRNYLFLGPVRRSMSLDTLIDVCRVLGISLATLDERARQRLE
ncbi:helix-turn-helix domain-containing protein [Agromyces ramosus]|uniref:DNA-binding Xre family transcriptional regulator n=1 Tax=Agromyces ramosus TaxID=33879 RepID=A0ABU0R8S6_9MICO|nr:helix-turn-helix domain-containing protein [Agromyces ramosus]MDQ0894470.1 DNA-binding Xre family transcriptional regulator [Agromyces ramosus]